MSEQKQKPEEQTLEKQILGIYTDIVTNDLAYVKQFFHEHTASILQAKVLEFDETMAKGVLGLKADPMRGADSVESLGRKLALEKADTGKRTLAKEDGPTPEGTLTPNMIDKMFEDARKGKRTE